MNDSLTSSDYIDFNVEDKDWKYNTKKESHETCHKKVKKLIRS